MKYAIALAVLCSCTFAETNDRPACTSQHLGRFWPVEANTDSALARRLTQTGELQICTRSGIRYKWEHISVNFKVLAERARSRKKEQAP